MPHAMPNRHRPERAHRKRAVVVVLVAIALTVIMGMAALSIDMGMLYSVKNELQRSADAAALAAASELALGGDATAADLAVDAANEVVARNPVLKETMGVSAAANLEMGQALPDANGKLQFSPGGPPYDAVRVTLERNSNSNEGPINLLFARALGHQTANVKARAAAVLVPRDIAVIIDLSNSMNHDSQLRYWDRGDGGASNLRDIWAALDGPEPSRPYYPGAETDTEYAGDTGPTYGIMTDWGSPLLPSSYDPYSDSGLTYLPRYSSTNDANILASLQARGYSNEEISALMSGSLDGSKAHWKNRICVLLGLAEWRSGKSGGKYGSGGGDGDNKIENSEAINWLPYPSWRGNWSWKGYVYWVAYTGVYRYYRPEFRYRYGLKTFTDYLLESHPENYATTNLWATPEEPVRAAKDAVQSMIDVISAADSLDHVSLEIFASTSRHEVDLTGSLQQVPDTLYERQSGHYDRATNIAGGLIEAIAELQSARARPNAHKVIILMSDGVANTDEAGNYVGEGSATVRQYALNRAQEAADLGFVIHTISLGYSVDRDLLQNIALIGHGQEFYAAGSPADYSDQLEQIFRSLGGKRPVALIE